MLIDKLYKGRKVWVSLVNGGRIDGEVFSADESGITLSAESTPLRLIPMTSIVMIGLTEDVY